MNEEELEKPKLIWKGSVGEALKTGRLTQEQVDKWNIEEEMGEDYMKKKCKKCKKKTEHIKCGFGTSGSICGNGRYRCLNCGEERR